MLPAKVKQMAGVGHYLYALTEEGEIWRKNTLLDPEWNKGWVRYG